MHRLEVEAARPPDPPPTGWHTHHVVNADSFECNHECDPLTGHHVQMVPNPVDFAVVANWCEA